MKIEHDAFEPIDFGVLSIYCCSKSCAITKGGYVEEYVWRQNVSGFEKKDENLNEKKQEEEGDDDEDEDD